MRLIAYDNRDARARVHAHAMRMCAYVCACARACLCVRVRARARVWSRSQRNILLHTTVLMHTIAQHTHASRACRGHACDAGHARELGAKNRWESVRLDKGGRVACGTRNHGQSAKSAPYVCIRQSQSPAINSNHFIRAHPNEQAINLQAVCEAGRHRLERAIGSWLLWQRGREL